MISTKCTTHLSSHLTSAHLFSWLEPGGRAFDPPISILYQFKIMEDFRRFADIYLRFIFEVDIRVVDFLLSVEKN